MGLGRCLPSTILPDLSPCVFDLIPKMKEPIRSILVQSVPDIFEAIDRTIQAINRTGTAKYVLGLPHRWKRFMHTAYEGL